MPGKVRRAEPRASRDRFEKATLDCLEDLGPSGSNRDAPMMDEQLGACFRKEKVFSRLTTPAGATMNASAASQSNALDASASANHIAENVTVTRRRALRQKLAFPVDHLFVSDR
jgi:hypothetical protein